MHLYSRSISVVYRANTVSCASCCTLFFYLAIIIVPYIATYAFGGMWTKESLVREQPTVRFRYEVVVEAYGSSELPAPGEPGLAFV